MTTVLEPLAPVSRGRLLLRAALFWVRRYLPAELAGTAALLVVGTVVHLRTGSAVATAVSGTVAETIGFYSVALFVILREQRQVAPGGAWTLLGRTVALGLAEFGLVDLLDSLLIRPALLLAGTLVLPSVTLGLLVGKLASDVFFYVGAATAYRLTERLGLRRGTRPAPSPVIAVTGPAPSAAVRAERCRELAARFNLAALATLADRVGGPLLLLDVETVRERYAALQEALPFVHLHYAVKALDDPDVLASLAADGARFDVASRAEIQALLELGVPGSRMLFSNPIATRQERLGAVTAGITTFVVDNPTELRKLVDLPEDCRVLVRLAYRSAAAHVDLSAKFGLDRAGAEQVVAEALELGVRIAGFSFHVGSQTDAVEPFVAAVTRTIEVMAALEACHGIRFTVLDIGGGFPVTYREASRTAPEIARVLAPLLAPLAERMEIVAEPGRCIVADAGIAVSRVVGIADRDDGRWYYLDDGVYGSYSNVMTEDVHPLLVAASELDGAASVLRPVALAGPTCDSADVIARGYPMPELAVGDLVLSPTMGAYTAVTSCRFNGREPATVLPVGLASRRRVAGRAGAGRRAVLTPVGFAPVPATSVALR